MIDIISKSNIKPFNISDFDYYIFTSKNGVNSFVNLDFVKGKKINALCLGKKNKSCFI
jgi:uroporphyrinogen-III synthase